MAEVLNVWIPIVSGVLGIIVTALGFIIPLVKNEKAKKALLTAQKIAEAVQPCIIDAEKFVNYTGEEKKQYVMTKANQYAIDNNLKFNADEVSALVESYVALTKQVNKRDKDKIVENTTNTTN